MASTDFNGDPILVISVEEARVAKTAISAVQALHVLGDMNIKDPDKWEKVAQKFVRFLDEVDSGV